MTTKRYTQHRFSIPSAPAADGAAAATLFDVFVVAGLPRSFLRELALVLPTVPVDDHLFVISTCARTAADLVATGADAAAEKDRCLELFVHVAGELRKRVLALHPDAFVDYVDPCSGLPTHLPGARVVFPEVDALESLLHFRTSNAGCCKILLHPSWGSYVYPATMFVRCPAMGQEEVARLLCSTLMEEVRATQVEV